MPEDLTMDSPPDDHLLAGRPLPPAAPPTDASQQHQDRKYQAYIESEASEDEIELGAQGHRPSSHEPGTAKPYNGRPNLSETDDWDSGMDSDSERTGPVDKPLRQERRIDVRDMLPPSPSLYTESSRGEHVRYGTSRRHSPRFKQVRHATSHPPARVNRQALGDAESWSYYHPGDYDIPREYYNPTPVRRHFAPHATGYAPYPPYYYPQWPRYTHEPWTETYGAEAARPPYNSYQDYHPQHIGMDARYAHPQQYYNPMSSWGMGSVLPPIGTAHEAPPTHVSPRTTRRSSIQSNRTSPQVPTIGEDISTAELLSNDWLHNPVQVSRPLWDANTMPQSSRIDRKVRISNAALHFSTNVTNHESQTSKAWLQARTEFPDGNGLSELISAENLECFGDGGHREKIILTRTSETGDTTESAKDLPPHITWLHVCRQTLSIDFLTRLVADCPSTIIGNDMKQVVRILLRDCQRSLQYGDKGHQLFEAGAAVRYTGTFAGDHDRETDPVVFLSIPHLSLRKQQHRASRTNDLRASTLLQTLYGYDMDYEREAHTPGSTRSPSFTVAQINVPQFWSITIGSGILITMSSSPLAEIRYGGIVIGHHNQHIEICRVKLILPDGDTAWFIIQRTSTLLDLRNQVAKRLRTKYQGAPFDIFENDSQLLLADTWISIMSSSIQNVTLFIQIKPLRRIEMAHKFDRLANSAAAAYQLIPYGQPDTTPHHQDSIYIGHDEKYGSYTSRSGASNPMATERFPRGMTSKPSYQLQLHQPNRSPPVLRHQSTAVSTGSGEISQRSQQIVKLNVENIYAWQYSVHQSTGQRTRSPADNHMQLRLGYRPYSEYSTDSTDRSLRDSLSASDSWEISETRLDKEGAASMKSLGDGRVPILYYHLPDSSGSTETATDVRSSTRFSDFEVKSYSSNDAREAGQSSSKDEAEPEANSPTRRAVWVSDPNGPNALVHEDFTDRTRSVSSGRSTPRVPSLPSTFATNLVPFFAWKTQSAPNEDKFHVAYRILDNVHQDLTEMHTERNLGKIYEKAYKCAYLGLRCRHLGWMKKLASSPCGSLANLASEVQSEFDISRTMRRGHSGCSQHPSPRRPLSLNSNDLGGDALAAGFSPAALSDSNDFVSKARQSPRGAASFPEGKGKEADTGCDSHFLTHIQILNLGSRSSGMMIEGLQQIFSISSGIIKLWIPTNSRFLHPLTERYWGSLDRIFRQTYYAAEHMDTPRSQQWFISKPQLIPEPMQLGNMEPPMTLAAYDNCPSCRIVCQYWSAQAAIEHLHSVHTSCSFTKQETAIFDDPCYVWLRAKHEQPSGSHSIAVSSMNQEFVFRLQQVYQAAKGLHSMALRTHNTEDLPLLPSKLVQAFQEIVMAHVVQAKCLSLMNEEMATKSAEDTKATPSLADRFASKPLRKNQAKIDLMKSSANACFARAISFIEDACDDMRFSGDQLNTGDNITIDRVGVEYLVAVIIGHLQTEGPESNSREIRDRFCKHMSRLRFEAHLKPQRRVFLDLHDLQEGLRGVLGVHESQAQLLRDYGALVKPNPSSEDTPLRLPIYRLEHDLLRKLSRRTAQHDRELRALVGQSDLLRQQVKQSIEILEEGHGKAIRVFTIVTLFFLPLSFVSSFFGMNTVDIRDTESSQALYWSIALPITLGVVAIAVLYGYKWEGFMGLMRAALAVTKEACGSLSAWSGRDMIGGPPSRPREHLLTSAEHEKDNGGPETRPQWEFTPRWPWTHRPALNRQRWGFSRPPRADTGNTLGE